MSSLVRWWPARRTHHGEVAVLRARREQRGFDSWELNTALEFVAEMGTLNLDVIREPTRPISAIADKIEPFLRVLAEEFEPEQIIIFGSYLRTNVSALPMPQRNWRLNRASPASSCCKKLPSDI